MSGFEVAGVVLGAFPIAITALEKYREAARRVNLFYTIRREHKKCRDDLVFYHLLFKNNLRRLLLPLVVDDDQIEELLATPGGPGWKGKELDDLLRKRIKNGYMLYFEYIAEMKRIMDELNRELALDSEAVRRNVNSTENLTGKERFWAAISKDGRAFQLYKIKFSNAESARKRLLSDFKNYNDKLEKLLDFNDEDIRLVQERDIMAQQTSIDLVICSFWKQATKLFRALASAWNCRCETTHGAELMLQHRTSRHAEFYITFTRFDCDSSEWSICRTRISESDTVPAAQLHQTDQIQEATSFQPPDHRKLLPRRSAMKSSTASNCVQLLQKSPSITLTCAPPSAQFGITQEISILCTALSTSDGSCYGFVKEEDCRFYIYSLSRQVMTSSPSFATLGQILRGDIVPQPTRRQRYELALILASSFLQLLTSSWLPISFSKADIFFKHDPNDSTRFLLDQPHILRHFNSRRDAKSSETTVTASGVSDSLDQLGIMLLELCFGKPLEDQPCRREWPEGGNTKETAVFDLMAARNWQGQILEEAGFDYAEAVGWCLDDNKIPSIALNTYELSDATSLEYYALSYTWGRPRKNAPDYPDKEACLILLNNQEFCVQPNLYDVLLQLHQFCSRKGLWIDALCINQEDLTERQFQVTVMNQIYGSASLVIIWLGKPFSQLQLGLEVIGRISDVAFREVSRILKEQRYDITLDMDDMERKFGLLPFTMEECDAIITVFESRWFGRVWVIQEVALAKQVGVLHGDSIIPFDKFGAVATFLHLTGLSVAIATKIENAGRGRQVDLVTDVFLYQAERTQILREWCLGDRSAWTKLMPLVDFTSGLEDESRETGTAGLILLKLLMWTIGFKATDHRDTIYGLWGILQHIANARGVEIPGHLRPNYGISATELFETVAMEILETSGTLLLLTLVKDPQQRLLKELPSWCPDFSSVVGSHPICGPALKSVAHVNAGGYIDGGLRSLPFGGQGMFDKWIKILLKMDKIYAPTGQPAIEGFWRTLIHDQDLSTRPAKLVRRHELRSLLLCQGAGRLRADFTISGTEAVSKRIESWTDLDKLTERYPDDTEGTDVLRTYCRGKGFLPTAEGEKLVTEEESDAWKARSYDGATTLIMLMGMTVLYRCMALTAGGHLAHATASTCVGDVLWVLSGCPSPLVLRKVGQDYCVIGEAYVHGVMNGEAITNDAAWQDITLV
ncbi:hypothetical protein NM208_g6132 [Fusarium decemcellulare]|uniref:Uncharacterized protein n=1 Tax=Fusarium decemcellulare TaxID=57161 RepID=A0ACC1SEE8_9HYPO|nr:hypothetical protein NM208_g6132 [Fusarium decemcellulare]